MTTIVTLYEHDNYGGASTELKTTFFSNPDLRPYNFNDKASSYIVIDPAYVVHFYQNIGYGGDTFAVRPSPLFSNAIYYNDLNKTSFNDKISSYKAVYIDPSGLPGVQLQENPGYGTDGRIGFFPIGNYPNLDNTIIKNDKAGYFNIWPNTSVTFYDSQNYGGTSWTFNNGNTVNFIQIDPALFKKAASIKVF